MSGKALRMLTGVLLLGMAIGCGGPPPVTSSEALRSVDALYTAITSKRPDLLSQTEERLRQYQSEGKLSDDAMSHLAGIIQTAREEQWQPAAEALDAFIRNQP